MLRHLPLLLAAFALVGCDDLNFGDRIEEYIYKNIYALSKDSASASIEESWNKTFQLGAQGGVARNELVGKKLAAVALPEVRASLSLDEAVAALPGLDASVASLIEATRENEDSLGRLEALGTACDDRHLFDSLGLDRVAQRVPVKLVVPKKQKAFAIFIGGTFGDSGAKGGSGNSSNSNSGVVASGSWAEFRRTVSWNLFRWKADQQFGKIDGAIQAIPALAMGSNESFAVSREICRTKRAFYAADLQRAKDASLALAQALGEKLRAVRTARRLAEQKVVTSTIAEATRSSGYADFLARIERADFAGLLRQDLLRSDEELKRLRGAIAAASGCTARLAAAEEYGDALAEADAVLRALNLATLPANLRAPVAEAAARVQGYAATLRTQTLSLQKESCQ